MFRFRYLPALGLLLLAAACNDEGMKYVSGPDDPSLKTTNQDLTQVEQLLANQEQKDISAGLRKPPSERAVAASEAMPAGHPPVAESSMAGGPGSVSAGGAVNLQVLEGELPPGWTAGPPTSPMRLAEISIPAAAGDSEGGTIGVFPEIGGGVEANIERWYKQISQPDGSPTKDKAKVEFLTAASGLDVILVDVAGTFDGSTMMAQVKPEPNWRLLGAIVKSPKGLVFLKGTGPEKTMEANRDAMVAFLRTLRLPGTPPAGEMNVAATEKIDPHGAVPSTSAAIPQAPAATAGGPIDLGVMSGTLPEGWSAGVPSSSMRVAEVTLPAAAGDPENGELVAFYFGPGQGGSVDDNINRWVGQMEGAAEPKRETFFAGGMPVTLVDVAGTFSATSMRPGAPPSAPKSNYRLLGAIVEGPRGSVFFKATGPDRTMQTQRDAFVEFLKSLRPKV